MKVHQNSVFVNLFHTILHFQTYWLFLIGEHSNDKKVPLSVHYFSSSGCIPIFILVGKVVFLVCIQSALIAVFLRMSAPLERAPHSGERPPSDKKFFDGRPSIP